jgi:lysozyme
MSLRPCVIDLYHGDPDPDFQKAYDAGIRAVIHKASEGTEPDPKYLERYQEARKVPGLLWGAYHFARPGNPVNQVETFLDAVSNAKKCTSSIPGNYSKDIVYVLDHEDPRVGMWFAGRFLELVKQATGKTPWIYSGFLIREQMENRHAPAFAQYPLWLAEYGPVAKVPQPWTTCILHQYTDGHDGPEPHRIDGMPGGLDISSFAGSDEQLKNAWLA